MDKITGFEGLRDLIKQKSAEPSESEIYRRVKASFKKAIDSMKEIGDRPQLEVSTEFLVNYHQENGIDEMKMLLSKISVLVDIEGYNYLIKIGVIKRNYEIRKSC